MKSFAERFRGGDLLLGTFIKTPTSHASEILGDAGLDFVVVDQEHAPIGRGAIDQIMLGCRAAGIAGLVRVPSPQPSDILSVLDCGATGVLVPHVASVERARAMAEAARYRGGHRGFSNSPRAGRYGVTGMHDHIAQQDRDIVTLAMIEDPEALDVIDDILAVDGLDGIFIGRGDLTVSMKAKSAQEPEVQAAVAKILAAAARAGKPACVMVGGVADATGFREAGASAFIVSSDQGLMRLGAQRLRKDFAPLTEARTPAE
ncbi:aldolase [Pseudooceanicola sp. 216_PA32_1]|uniref:Aldolase n=1 Tax=Pseudooceanicola pacificus TaxID=2676438 RepID=A0A844W7F9_9RHOB|nr:aldolase/citrate lyase family protein [Pseudooceanicola pacificus]MWB78694.1 aldolase [Pseudooceanicola pacificus]